MAIRTFEVPGGFSGGSSIEVKRDNQVDNVDIWPISGTLPCPEAMLLRICKKHWPTISPDCILPYLYPQREWHRPENAKKWTTGPAYYVAFKTHSTAFATSSTATTDDHKTYYTAPPTYSGLEWLSAALRVVAFLIQTLYPLSGYAEPELRMYCDYWWCIIDDAHRKLRSQAEWPNWKWWLRITDPRRAEVFGTHQIHLAQRLFTHLHVIYNPIKNLTPAAEKHDIPLCLMRRAWTPRIQHKAFYERMYKLCNDSSSPVQARECALTLYRIKLAAWLGFVPEVPDEVIVREPERRRVLLQAWKTAMKTPDKPPPRSPYCWDLVVSKTHERPLDEDGVDEEGNLTLIANALQAYMREYIQSHVVLRKFIERHFPKWPASSASNSATASCWLPCEPLMFLRLTMLSSKTLRKYLAQTPSVSDTVELEAEVMLDAIATVRHADQLLALEVLAEWHKVPMVLFNQLMTQLKQFQHGILTKSRIRKLLSKWQTSNSDTEGHMLRWITTIVNVWAANTLVRVIPAPLSWTLNVTANYARHEQATRTTISPMADVFLYCPVCLRICSIVAPLIAPTRKRRKKRKKRKIAPPSLYDMDIVGVGETDDNTAANPNEDDAQNACHGLSAGFEHVVVDIDNDGMLMCASRKSGLTAVECSNTQLKQIHMTGYILQFYDRVYMLCPQPGCGRLMQLEPNACKYTEHGPCCKVCTAGLTIPPPAPPQTERAPEHPLTVEEIFENAAKAEQAGHRNEKLFDSDDDDIMN